jgi:hypothetical protein
VNRVATARPSEMFDDLDPLDHSSRTELVRRLVATLSFDHCGTHGEGQHRVGDLRGLVLVDSEQ